MTLTPQLFGRILFGSLVGGLLGYGVWYYSPLGKQYYRAWLLRTWTDMAGERSHGSDLETLYQNLQLLTMRELRLFEQLTMFDPLGVDDNGLLGPAEAEKFHDLLFKLSWEGTFKKGTWKSLEGLILPS